MASRVCLVSALVLASAVVAASTAASQSPTGTAIYVVRVDKRLCPSPLCGGYWVAIANGARTRCANGLRYPQCYVARASDAAGKPLDGIAEGSLARGALDLGRDDLGELVASAVYAPAGTAPVSGHYVRVRDNGIRCVRAPCFSFTVATINGSWRSRVSNIDARAAQAAPTEVARALAALRTKDGLYARARFGGTRDGGTVLRALRLYLKAP